VVVVDDHGITATRRSEGNRLPWRVI